MNLPEFVLDEAQEDAEVMAGTTKPSRPVIGFSDPSAGSGQVKRKILVVDDNDENRTLLRDILLPLGFDLLEATNGLEALNKLVIASEAKQAPPDLILMDLLMPDMDGFEATRRIRELETENWILDTGYSKLETDDQGSASSPQPPASSIQPPVIIGVSASVSPQIRQQSLEAGCNDFLGKPIRMDELLDCLHRYLGLEWIYEEPSQIDREEQPLVVPPQEMLLTLLEFAKSGYITDIHETITQMKAADQNLLPFANRIEQLTKNFQFEQIIELIKSSLKGVQK